MSNFDFLKDYDETLWKLGNRIEKQVAVSPSGVKADATPFLEHILEELLHMIGKAFNPRKDFYTQLDAVYRAGKINYGFKQKIYGAYQLRNKIHDNFDEIEKNEFIVAMQLHERLFYIAKKFYRDYNEDYDEYKGVPSYKPIELDTTDDEIELIKIPDFSEIIDIKYDYCVICGEPNHSNYSLCCEKCNRVMDNANNFISIRNSFGKDYRFTKEDLIEYGIPEGYANQLISSLVRENMLSVKGRYITFNNMHIDEYLAKIDAYISVCELVTRFREDKITPSEIKQTREYKQGSFNQEPFYQFYKIVDNEIVNKFEKDILTTENIQSSMEYTTITQKQLQRWYTINLNRYNKNVINESFIVFNELLMADYIELKGQGVLERDIQKQLNITPEIYDFFTRYDPAFEESVREIKKELLLKLLSENKTRAEAIEIAGVTEKEYNDLVKYSDFKDDEFSKRRNIEVEARKESLINYLAGNDLETACNLAKISITDFYGWYEKDVTSEFYLKTTRVLMDSFLAERKKGRTRAEATQTIGIEEKYVDHWFKRNLKICDEFKNEHVKVTVDLIYDGFVNSKSKSEIAKVADVSVNRINTYLNLGKRGYGTYKKLYDYYEEFVIPSQLSRFLGEIKNKPLKKALELSDLSQEEFEECLEKAKRGDERYKDFLDDFYKIKLNIFLKNVTKGKGKGKALKNAFLTEDELDECYRLGKQGDERFADFYQKYYEFKLKTYMKEINRGTDKSQALKKADLMEDELQTDIDEVIFNKNLNTVMNCLLRDFTTKQAAKVAGIGIDVIFDWYFKGRKGDERLEQFSDYYYNCYIFPGSVSTQNAMRDGIPLNDFLKKMRKMFTREDYNFWLKNGFLAEANEKLDEVEDEDEFVKETIEKIKEYIKEHDDLKSYLR